MDINRKNLSDAIGMLYLGDIGKDEDSRRCIGISNSMICSFDTKNIIIVNIKEFTEIPDGEIIAVDSEPFKNIINLFNTDIVNIAIRDDKIIVRNEKAKLCIPIIPDSIIGKMIGSSNFNDTEFNDVPDDFIPAVKSCIIRNNSSMLSGIFVSSDVVYSTDTIEINSAVVSKEIGRFWLDTNSIEIVCKMNPTGILCSSNFVYFKSDKSILRCLKIEDSKYPESIISDIILAESQKEDSDICEKMDKELLDSIRRASLFSNKLSNLEFVNMKFDSDKLIIKSENGNGSFEEIFMREKSKDSDKLCIKINPKCFMSAPELFDSFYIKKIKKDDKESTRIIFSNGNCIKIIGEIQE